MADTKAKKAVLLARLKQLDAKLEDVAAKRAQVVAALAKMDDA